MAFNNVINQFSSREGNICVAGDLSTNPWQRGDTHNPISNNTYSADRFKYFQVGTTVANITKDADFDTGSYLFPTSSHALKYDISTADPSVAAGDYLQLQYPVEGYDFLSLAQKPMTLSFRVKSNVTGTFCISLRNTANDRSFVAEYTIDSPSTWEDKVINIPASPAGGTWNYTFGVGLVITFVFQAGTTFHTTPGTWQTGNFLSTSNQVNLSAAMNNFSIKFVQLQGGSTDTPYPVLPYQEVVTYCQRYFWKTFPLNVAPQQAWGTSSGALTYASILAGAGQSGLGVRFPVPMRSSSPAATFYNPSAANSNWRNYTGGADSGAATISLDDESGMSVRNAGAAADAVGDFLAVHCAVDADF